MPTAETASPVPVVARPAHPLHALTTYELRAYRRQLEHAIAFFAARTPVPPARADLQARLDGVKHEQAERAELAARA